MSSLTGVDWKPGATGPAGTTPHPDPGPEPVHVPRQVPLHAQRHGRVHQPEQDPQPARVRGRDRPQVPQHQVSGLIFGSSCPFDDFLSTLVCALGWITFSLVVMASYLMICVFERFCFVPFIGSFHRDSVHDNNFSVNMSQ